MEALEGSWYLSPSGLEEETWLKDCFVIQDATTTSSVAFAVNTYTESNTDVSNKSSTPRFRPTTFSVTQLLSGQREGQNATSGNLASKSYDIIQCNNNFVLARTCCSAVAF